MSNNKYMPKISDLSQVVRGENFEELIVINKISKNIICQYEKSSMNKYLGKDVFVRKTVSNKLLKISEKLKKINSKYKLKIVYGYRHPEVQVKYFKEKRLEILKDIDQNLNDKEINEKTHSFVAHPSVAGHPTGGAIDITITSTQGDLDMGTKIADYSNENKIKTFSNLINEEQKENRKLLHDLMISEEFAPFYGEWWHFSYGDLEWALFYKKESSIYSKKKISNKKASQ